MKNGDIITLLDCGVLSITSHTLSTAHAYKVYKLRKAIDKAVNDIAIAERGLQLECGISDPDAFDKKRAALRRASNDSEELSKMDAQLARYLEMRNKLYDDDVALEGVKAMPYDEWRKLQDENKAVEIRGRAVDVLSGKAEMILEDILWKAPSEEE